MYIQINIFFFSFLDNSFTRIINAAIAIYLFHIQYNIIFYYLFKIIIIQRFYYTSYLKFKFNIPCCQNMRLWGNTSIKS